LKRHRSQPPAPAPFQSARSAGLVYVSNRTTGIRRRRNGRGFRYLDAQGRPLRSPSQLDRIRRLAIPPAWQQVWICPNADGHLQATGRDARGRLQYRYHPEWRKVRDEAKYEQMLDFAAALPALRQRIAKDLSKQGLSKRTVVAAVVQLLERTLIRIGNDEYSRENHSFGLTTMRNAHAQVSRSTIRFRFRGKGGKSHDIAVDDGRLARIVRRCQDLPGHELFEYVDDRGHTQDVGSDDVNAYLRETTGQDFTAKTFRTWAATVLAACALQEMPLFTSKTQARRHIVKAVEGVAGVLRNTPSICRKSYIHPAVIDAYSESISPFNGPRPTGRRLPRPHDFHRMETVVLALLRRLNRSPRQKAA
jgi:DNA topoisomerase-1